VTAPTPPRPPAWTGLMVCALGLLLMAPWCGSQGVPYKRRLPDMAGGGKGCGDLGSTRPLVHDGGPAPIACAGDCLDFVLNGVYLSQTLADALKVGVIHGGRAYNAFGTLLSGVAATLGGSLPILLAVNDGKMLLLFRLQAPSFTAAASVKAQFWIGASRRCCHNPSDLAACVAEAHKTCFNGRAVLWPAPGAPGPLVHTGKIAGSRLSLGPGPLVLRFVSNLNSIPADIPLVRAQVRGLLHAGGLSDGVLAGGIPTWAVRAVILPLLAQILDRTYKDNSTSLDMRRKMRDFLDIDRDGSITHCELAGNSMLSPFLKPDVDLDGDGEKEFSLGVGFSAVGAVIVDGPPPGDGGAGGGS
jgi:hypothetical protein